ncbi:MAG: hypothetical protein KJZ93_20715 [Caldilineaceae bacterium]|nr:hypothetical protein [Caldilineaceae bacterium]
MNKTNDKSTPDPEGGLKAHYDFDYSKAKPNRFAEQFGQESIVVVLEPDVAAVFPTSEAVNEALRVIAAALQHIPTDKAVKRRKPRMKKAAPV